MYASGPCPFLAVGKSLGCIGLPEAFNATDVIAKEARTEKKFSFMLFFDSFVNLLSLTV
jgi:hypothetical protein